MRGLAIRSAFPRHVSPSRHRRARSVAGGRQPGSELEHLLRHLGGTGGLRNRLPSPIRTRWPERFLDVSADAGIRALLALQGSGYGVNFVAPPPLGVAQTLSDDLAAFRATALSLARAEISTALAVGPGTRPADRQMALPSRCRNPTESKT
jgi:hypothetical protein